MTRVKMDWPNLTEEDAERRRSALRTMLEQGFNLPVKRLEFTRRNLEWLRRNISIENAENPMLRTAFNMIVWLIRWDTRQKNAG